MSVSDECGFDAAAYALGALDAREVRAFRAHLEGCAVCRDELAAFEDVAAVLPLAVRQADPPGRLRRRVLAEVHADVRARARAGRFRQGFFRAVLAQPAATLACVLVLAVVGAALVAAGSGRTPGAQHYAATVLAPRGTAQLQVVRGRARLVVHHFPAPRAGHVYEVWLQQSANGAPEPTRALFGVDPAGDAAVPVPGDVAHLHRVLVTQEPAGGTAVPTTAPVIVATL